MIFVECSVQGLHIYYFIVNTEDISLLEVHFSGGTHVGCVYSQDRIDRGRAIKGWGRREVHMGGVPASG
jgi:hypothetical protein